MKKIKLSLKGQQKVLCPYCHREMTEKKTAFQKKTYYWCGKCGVIVSSKENAWKKEGEKNAY